MAQSVKEPTTGMGEPSAALRLQLACGAIGPLLFIVVFLIEGATRAGYDPLRYPVSSLSIGNLGWIQIANFLMVGLSLVVFAFGLQRALGSSKRISWGPLLIGLAGIGLFGAGVFVSDPVFGYPTSEPLALAQFSVHGHLHDAFSLLLFLGLPPACFVLCQRFLKMGKRGWAVYSLLAGIGMLVAFALAGQGFTHKVTNLIAVAGVFQRLSIAIGLTWVAALAFWLMRQKFPIGR